MWRRVGVSVGALYDRPDDFVRALDAGGVSSIRVAITTWALDPTGFSLK